MAITQAEIARRFDFHSPTAPEINATLDALRAAFKSLAEVIVGTTPANREQALALTHLEDALASTIGAIVRPEIPR